MKKQFFVGIAVLAIAAVAAFNVNLNTPENDMSALSLANVEALADNESGTSVGWCYFEQPFFSNSPGFKKVCDSRTNSSTIYPCPSTDSYSRYSDAAKDRCTN